MNTVSEAVEKSTCDTSAWYGAGDASSVTALFVDFDNVYSRLAETSMLAAEAFATCPLRWLGWLSNAGSGPAGRVCRQRTFAVRRCYLNPALFGRYRSRLTSAGFQSVDCPKLTFSGKNVADIHITVDALELLWQTDRIGHFVLLTSDCDFIPLRPHAAKCALAVIFDKICSGLPGMSPVLAEPFAPMPERDALKLLWQMGRIDEFLLLVTGSPPDDTRRRNLAHWCELTDSLS